MHPSLSASDPLSFARLTLPHSFTKAVAAAALLTGVVLGLPAQSAVAAEPTLSALALTGTGSIALQLEGTEALFESDHHHDGDPYENLDSLVANAPQRPAGETARVDGAPPPAPAPIRPKVGVGRYTVVPGDTMFGIARRTGLTLQALSAANGIVDPNSVKAGRVLYIPAVPGAVHAVAGGDTLSSLADRYEVTLDSVLQANGIANGSKLSVGQLLVIPGVNRAAAATEIRPLPNSMAAAVLPSGGPAGAPGGAPAAKSSQPAERLVLTAQSGSMIWPVSGPISTSYTPTHRGLDVVAVQGTPIKAALAGKVVAAQEWDGPYGWYVILEHGGEFTTVYSHLSKIKVNVGDTVKQGQIIGEVGSTGRSTGPHLHFEIRKSNLPIDPRPYLP